METWNLSTQYLFESIILIDNIYISHLNSQNTFEKMNSYTTQSLNRYRSSFIESIDVSISPRPKGKSRY